MRQLARTLVILGVAACERAHPVADDVRPATPLVDPAGAPAVGNIGQTGAPAMASPPSPSRRAERVQRAQRAARAITAPAPGASAPGLDDAIPARPVLPARVPPAARPPSPLAPSGPTLSIQTGQPELAASPLLDRRRRPAVANMGRRARLGTPRERLAEQAESIALVEQRLREVTNDDERGALEAYRAELVAAYRLLAHEVAQAERADP